MNLSSLEDFKLPGPAAHLFLVATLVMAVLILSGVDPRPGKLADAIMFL